MAQLFPNDVEAVAQEHRFYGEMATLLRLRDELPDQYAVFHGVHWTKVEDNAAIYGEIDFLIVNPYGKVLAIEQKETAIEQDAKGELFALYEQANGKKTKKNIRAQVTRNIQSLRQEFSKRYPNQSLQIDHLLYLPTAKISGAIPANIALGRIVDANEAKYLIDIICHIIEDHPMPSGDDAPDGLTVREFLSEKTDITPQLGLLGASAKIMTTRLSSGLAQWVQRLDFSPFRLWVQGTAGSGKTQLALQELKRAKARGQTALYLCFNRPLADAMKLSAPEPNVCMTVHELAQWLAKQKGMAIDFSQEGIFARLMANLLANIADLQAQLDLLIIDEGQDFEPHWGSALVSMVKEGGRTLWLEDASQDLYGRWNTHWPDWVKLSSPMNYRSPQRLVGLINALELTQEKLESGNAYAGMIPDIYPYPKGAVLEATEAAVRDLIEQGYAPEAIAVLSFRGVVNSQLLNKDVMEIAGLKVKKFQGYDSAGHAQWSEGSLFVDTLFRFKGQCADAVVLTEIDFDEWTDDVKKRLFVGLTRARLMASLVLSESASSLIDAKLGI